MSANVCSNSHSSSSPSSVHVVAFGESGDIVFSLLPDEVVSLLEANGYCYDYDTHFVFPLTLYPHGLSSEVRDCLKGVSREKS